MAASVTTSAIPQAFIDAFRQLVRRIQPTRAIEPAALRDYYEILQGFPLSRVTQAATILAQQPRVFFPSVGEWRQAVLAIEAAQRSVGSPRPSGEWPYDPHETFSEAELDHAQWWRIHGAHNTCPHQPACPTLAVCVEEIAWYLRHRIEIHAQLRAQGE